MAAAPPRQQGDAGPAAPAPGHRAARSRRSGLLAGLSDDDPAGITTYSVLGADHGYQLLWVLLLSTIALIVFHTLAARMGVITGQGLIGLVRQRYGVRIGGAVTCRSGGRQHRHDMRRIRRHCSGFRAVRHQSLCQRARRRSVRLAARAARQLSPRRRLLLLLSTVFLAYIASGILAKPDWGAALHGALVPTMPMTGQAIGIVTATLGTTLAVGLSFMQSYAVTEAAHRGPAARAGRRRHRRGAHRGDRFFVVVACAATLHREGRSISDAATPPSHCNLLPVTPPRHCSRSA